MPQGPCPSRGPEVGAALIRRESRSLPLEADILGVSSWVRTLESIPAWWEAQRAALHHELGDPAVDGERLWRISPLFHAGNIRRPLMVLQGVAKDPRVLRIEFDEVVDAVHQNGVVRGAGRAGPERVLTSRPIEPRRGAG